MNDAVIASMLAIEATTELGAGRRPAEWPLTRLDFKKFAVSFLRSDGLEAAEFVPLDADADAVLLERTEQSFFLLDPLAQHCLRMATPFVWEEMLTLSDQRSIVRRFYSNGAQHSHSLGMTKPMALRNGLRGTVRFLGTKAQFGARQHLDLTLLGLVLHSRIADLARIVTARGERIHLTEREQETLRWGAQGKTSEDIASILGITKRTIDQHFENAAKKLGTANRVQTVVKAMREGLIDL